MNDKQRLAKLRAKLEDWESNLRANYTHNERQGHDPATYRDRMNAQLDLIQDVRTLIA